MAFIDKGVVTPNQTIRRLSNNHAAQAIVQADTAAVDAFHRLRVSEPVNIMDGKFLYGELSGLFNEELNGTGASATWLSDEVAYRLRVGTANGEYAIRQTRQYMQYIPGKSQFTLMTGVIGAPKANVVQRMGYFDNYNGIFIEQTENGPYIVKRSNTTGTIVEERIPQAEWNLDRMNGHGKVHNPSGETLDLSKAQILVIDLQWLGVGRVRVGFGIEGGIIMCHQFNASNIISSVYMASANLPVRYEIRNVGVSASNTDLIEICFTVNSEGGYEATGFEHAADNGNTPIAVSTTAVCVLAVKLKDTFAGKENRATAYMQHFSLLATGADYYYSIRHFHSETNDLTGGTWTSVEADSHMEYNVGITAFANGHKIHSGYIKGGVGVAGTSISGQTISPQGSRHLTLTQDFDSNDSQAFGIIAQSLGGAGEFSGALDWREVY